MAKRITGESEERRRAQDDLLVEALALGRSYADAGSAAGVSGRTVQRRMAEPEFSARVAARRNETVVQVTGGLAGLSVEAVEVLRRRLRDDQEPGPQLRAAGMVLSQLIRFRQIGEFEDRLREVENRLGVAASTVVEVVDES